MTPFRAIAYATCIALGAHAADAPTFEIREAVPLHVLTLPVPKGWWGPEARKPAVRDLPGHAFLDFVAMKGPLGGVLPPEPYFTFVEHLRGVRDVDGAKAHFKAVHGIDLARPRQEDDPPSWGQLEVRTYPYGRVLIVDLGKLGWVPGNRYYYFFFDADPPVTVYMGPTWYMDYDLSKARLEPAPRGAR